jgi:hypothetical protein
MAARRAASPELLRMACSDCTHSCRESDSSAATCCCRCWRFAPAFAPAARVDCVARSARSTVTAVLSAWDATTVAC